jgi:hypothetical protein
MVLEVGFGKTFAAIETFRCCDGRESIDDKQNKVSLKVPTLCERLLFA